VGSAIEPFHGPVIWRQMDRANSEPRATAWTGNNHANQVSVASIDLVLTGLSRQKLRKMNE
jgi:hypothetical protein